MDPSTDHEKLIRALRRLAPDIKPSTDRAWRREPALRVLDCVLSLNRPYDRFVVPRLDRFERDFSEVRSVADLRAKIATFPSAHSFVLETLDYDHAERAITLEQVVSRLAEITGSGDESQQLQRLEDWARTYRDDAILRIRGFGLAGYQYMRMLFGANTTKPDLRIREWVAQAIGRPVSPHAALRMLEEAATMLGISLRDLDTTIWEMLARRGTTVGSAPISPRRVRQIAGDRCQSLSTELRTRPPQRTTPMFRQITVISQDVLSEGGRGLATPCRRVAACGVLSNPHAGKPPIDDFSDLVDLSVEAGTILTARALEALGEIRPRGYGKAVIVGTAGDLEHGASMIHVRIGLAMRRGAGGGPALIPGNAKTGGPGTPVDVIFGGMEDAWDYDAMDSMTVSVPDAPRADEVLLIVAFLGGTRPNARIKGASADQVADVMRQIR
ncbi:MAG: amino acid synthesis family protein [Acetobacteraceae bacterium]